MRYRSFALLSLCLLAAAPAVAQAPPPGEALPPAAAPQPLGPPPASGPQPPATTEGGATQPGRVFCGQNVSYQLADRAMVPEEDRRFIGAWSDAAWDPHTCAALIVEDVKPDGTASIIYIYGPQGSDAQGPGGVLHGTGIIRDGELRFQNSDGSQFAFRPGIVDMMGHLINPKGEGFAATFKATP